MTLPDTPGDSPLHSYDFVLDIPTLGDRDSYHRECICANTLPSYPSGSSFPGLFHQDHCNGLLTLKVKTIDPPWSTFLHVTHATLLSYIATHASDANTVSVPWEAWGPSNTRILNPPHAPEIFNSRVTCSMHALIQSVDLKKLHTMDYHPGRIARIQATHDAQPYLHRGNNNRRRVASLRCDHSATTRYWHTVSHRHSIRSKGHTTPRWTSV